MPSAITDDPTYNGCALQRYGPERVTSRPFSRCPAAQMRMSSPTIAIARPMRQLDSVGCARTAVTTAVTNPSGTRFRARKRSSELALASATCGNPVLRGRDDLVDGNVLDARLQQPALALVVTDAARIARNGDVVARPRPVPFGIGRPEERDDRCSDRGCDVQRSGITRDHQLCASGDRED